MFLRVGAFTILLTAVLCSACSLLSHEAPVEDIDKAAALFFQRLDKGEFDAIYNDSAKDFKEKKTRQEVTENLQQVAASGKTVDYSRIKMPIEGQGKSRIFSPVFIVSFEKGAGELTLNFQDESGEWKLIGFAFKQHHQ